MTRNTRRVVGLGGGLLAAFLAALVGTMFFGRTVPPPLPIPNGYDDLIKAGQGIRGNVSAISELDTVALRLLVTNHANTLLLLRIGLSRTSAVPTESFIANFATASTDLTSLKALANLLRAEGRLAELERRPGDAARSYLDAIRLGGQMSHGGLIINRLVGIACEGVGCIPLVKLVPKLSGDEIRGLIAALEQVDEQTVSWDEITSNENRFTRAQLGSYPNPLRLATDLWLTRNVRRAAKERHEIALARLRLLAVELALRQHRSEIGTAPSQLEQLVPKYLRRAPTDPFSGRPLGYKPAGTNWLLYSVGPDRRDDNGAPAGKRTSDNYLIGLDDRAPDSPKRGDLLYDSPW